MANTLEYFLLHRTFINRSALLLSLVFVVSCLSVHPVNAQNNTNGFLPIEDSINSNRESAFKLQRDLVDLVFLAFHKNPDTRIHRQGPKNGTLYVSVAPVVEYTIATGFASGLTGNAAFKTDAKKQTNTSVILSAVKYTQKKQFLLPVQSSIFTTGNKYNFFGDWRYFNYLQDTYGLGGYTTEADKYTVTYQYLRFYEFAFKNIFKNLYGGLGYQLDYHWQIAESGVPPNRVTDFGKYGFSNNSSSSGVAAALIFDSRENSIDPDGGSMFGKVQILQNLTIIGSNSNWSSVLVADLATNRIMRKFVMVAPVAFNRIKARQQVDVRTTTGKVIPAKRQALVAQQIVSIANLQGKKNIQSGLFAEVTGPVAFTKPSILENSGKIGPVEAHHIILAGRPVFFPAPSAKQGFSNPVEKNQSALFHPFWTLSAAGAPEWTNTGWKMITW